MLEEKIVVLDFGSQYAHLIAKRFRLLGYYSEIALPSANIEAFEGAKGIVLSGGPASIYDQNAPEYNPAFFDLDIPILGMCYGHYVLNKHYGGKIEKANAGEFGYASLEKKQDVECPLFKGIKMPTQVWMSHQDGVIVPGKDFEIVGFTKDCPFAAVQNLEKKRFGLQFHVEVKDTPCGDTILENFARFCGISKNWNQDLVLNYIMKSITDTAKDKKVLLFLSGGVDSTVAFALLNKALGQERVLGLHIDSGFMRKNESKIIAEQYHNAGFTNFICEDASATFLNAISKKTDPQEKRKAVGETFITVRDKVVEKLHLNPEEWLLGQGTLYPDIIESGGTKNSHVIKTHHNRVDGIQALIEKGLIIEPLKDLYKDEVRLIGRKIGLKETLVARHPFPGPGLSINVLCQGTDFSAIKEAEKSSKELESFISKDSYKTGFKSRFIKSETGTNAPSFISSGVLPVKSVGVQGDFRTYRFPALLRFHNIWESFPLWSDLEQASSFITNGIKDVNRTVIALYESENLKLVEGYCDKHRLDQTREVDNIVLDELKKNDMYNKIFQHLTINLPYCAKENHCAIVLRPVVSEDVMTARFAHLAVPLLKKIVDRIEMLGFVDALYYDITNKPPATFGWE
ncbi:MAG: glutamine-hydrolyzing GMP synthase [Treponema sp.]|jgi:GMP synthase (glutamine-hydrolysing)|nr:glutamine-hydrolyzing GMP synthase [Treponema sp.]